MESEEEGSRAKTYVMRGASGRCHSTVRTLLPKALANDGSWSGATEGSGMPTPAQLPP